MIQLSYARLRMSSKIHSRNRTSRGEISASSARKQPMAASMPPSRDLRQRQRVAVRVLDPGGAEAPGVEHAPLVRADPGLVVLLERHAPGSELVDHRFEIVDEPARGCGGRAGGGFGRAGGEQPRGRPPRGGDAPAGGPFPPPPPPVTFVE